VPPLMSFSVLVLFFVWIIIVCFSWCFMLEAGASGLLLPPAAATNFGWREKKEHRGAGGKGRATLAPNLEGHTTSSLQPSGRTMLLSLAIWPGSKSFSCPFAKGRRPCRLVVAGEFLLNLRLTVGL
jgi:hypothetical protein